MKDIDTDDEFLISLVQERPASMGKRPWSILVHDWNYRAVESTALGRRRRKVNACETEFLYSSDIIT